MTDLTQAVLRECEMGEAVRYDARRRCSGIYVGLGLAGHVGTYGYVGRIRNNHRPICSLENSAYDSDVATDEKEQLLRVNSEYVYKSATMCGSRIASSPSDGFSKDVAGVAFRSRSCCSALRRTHCTCRCSSLTDYGRARS